MFACEDGISGPAPDCRRLHLSDAVTTIAAYPRMSAEMDSPSPEQTPQPARTPGDRLDSWKEIAAYLKRDVTTVRRWEKREGMPVHRHVHDKLGSVYAFWSELDAWTRSRSPQSASDDIDTELPADGGDSPAVLVDAPSQTIETVEPSHQRLAGQAIPRFSGAREES